jgi:glycosyltransferase involved in cell wall biosynthesis
VPPRDAGALAAAMVQVAADPGQARKLGEAGGRRVVERFGLSTMVRGHEAAYERLMTEKAGRVRDRRAG